MRLIDADALPVHKAYCVDEAGWGANFYVVDKSDIDKAPTIDAVLVVRCGKCRHAEFEQENRMWACVRCADYDEDYNMFTGFIEYHNEDHFCPDGERRSDDL